MLVEIDRGGSSPLYLQIHEQLRDLILLGALPEQTHLPPTRELAKALDVNRTTVVNAYRRLWSEGLIEGRSGGGTVVVPYRPDRPVASERHLLAWEALYTECVSEARCGLGPEQALADVGENLISFALEVASGDVSALYGVQEALAEPLLREKGILGHPPPQGDLRLRRLVAERLELEGIRATPSQVLILSGAEQGIFVVGQALLGHGDGVAAASPTCPAALRALRTLGARVHLVPMDEEGLRLDVLEGILKRFHPKLIFVEPTFENPTGITMSLARRQGLLEVAYRHHVPIFELDAYSHLHYEDHPLPALKALDRQNHVLYMGTSSAIIPALRVAWLVGPQRVARQLAPLKNSIEASTSGLGQAMACAIIPWLDAHLDTIVSVYRGRRDAMCEGLERNCHGLIRFVRPAGGLFLWGELEHGLSAKPLLDEALRAGVTYVPGSLFYPEGRGGKRSLRLNFACEPEDRIAEGVARLGSAIRGEAAGKLARSSARGEKGPAWAHRPVLAPEIASTDLAWEMNRRMAG